VVLRYQSDFGIIPITLTATGASENMGVQVWMLGAGRAIPRNYHHTVINDAAIDWVNGGANYNSVIIRAVGEAPERHTFVTEYSGSGAAVKNALLPAGRYGTQAEFAGAPNATEFVSLLWQRGFQGPTPLNPYGQLTLPSTVKAILSVYLPPPTGINLDTFYANYGAFVAQAPAQNYRPVQMAQELWDRVVVPSQRAAALFDTHPVLTRLYTTMSPADMNRDPAFSFNPSLAPVSNVHQATMRISCPNQTSQIGLLTTEQGWQLEYPNGQFGQPFVSLSSLPASLRVEIEKEEGPSQIVIDNLVKQASILTTSIHPTGSLEPTPQPQQPKPMRLVGCSVGSESLAVLALALLGLRRRQR
jgi:MYXO-CTERM domain-containing protein